MTKASNDGSFRQGPWTTLRPTAERFGFLQARDPSALEDRDPTTGELVAVVPQSTGDDVDRALERARAVSRARGWRNDGPLRARVLAGFAQALRADVDRLAELLCREQGKTIQEARSEIIGSAAMVEYYAGLAPAVYGRALSFGDDSHGVILREPVGVVAVITPWNWPLTLLVRSLAPALAAGNACVVKPASLTPAIVIEALELLHSQPDLPPGVLGCLVGPGSSVGDALVHHDGVDMIAFTGETGTGSAIMRAAAADLKKVALELGGKSPNIVFEDAPFDKAVAGAVNAAFTTTGQICTAGSRLLVQRSISEAFLDALTSALAELRLGDPLDPTTTLGPLVSANQLRTVQEYVELGRKEGTVVYSGSLPDDPGLQDGNFLAPVVFGGLPPSSRLIREEIFGPVLTVQTFEDEDEAIALAEDTDFGLAAGIWTTNLDRAWRVGRAVQAGTVWINTYHHFYPEAEVGGFRRSGLGRQQGLEGLVEFTETKHLNFDSRPSLW